METNETLVAKQNPTKSYILPYTHTDGKAAINLYNKTGQTAQEWQELLVYDMLAKNEDGLYTHTKFGYSLPRRNGKNEVIAMRELWALEQGEHVLHTAHRTATSHMAWERIKRLMELLGYTYPEDYKTISTLGMESVRLKKNGGQIDFRTRSTKGALGEGFDLLIIDEAQEYTDDQRSALQYVVSDSMNPQTVMLGTPPTPYSSGTVFTKYRRDTLNGETLNGGWAEWSVPKKTDPMDRAAWYDTNPSLGVILTERKIMDEITTDTDDFNIQRLGLWISYNLKSAISRVEWDALKIDGAPRLTGPLHVGIKYGHDGANVCVAIAAKMDDNRVFIECVDCQDVRSGNAWILAFLKEARPASVYVDGAAGDQLSQEMRRERLRPPVLMSVKDVTAASNMFSQAIFARTIAHAGQPALVQAATNCERRPIGSAGGFGFRAIKDPVEIALLESAINAFYACCEYRAKNKQLVRY